MDQKNSLKKYTVADLYKEAGLLVREEMSGLKHKPLNQVEIDKSEQLARMISKLVLKEMKIA